jgi:multidrug efflux pump subunit AcrB
MKDESEHYLIHPSSFILHPSSFIPGAIVFSRFFINRPIFASVLSIVITMAGGITMFTLPVTQYPEITPPTVEVSAVYPGANAEVVAATVAEPVEQQVNGVEDMLYMSSQSTNDGNYTLTISFKVGTDLNMAQVLVQNRVALAEPVLPDMVKRRGITVKKKSPSTLMIVNLFSPDRSRSSLYLSNYATIQLRDELARLPGVGDIGYIGQRDYSMRLWLDPGKLASKMLTADDVINAIAQQNVQVAAGQIGQPPVPRGQEFQYTITTLGRLADEEQFANMILKSEGGRIVYMKDVAKIELGALSYDQTCTLNGRPSVALAIYQLPGSNALSVANSVRNKMKELKTRFPEGLDYAIVYDTTPFITESVWEVFKTLRDAVILVSIVVLVFLQNWRSAIIPLVAVPVAIIGTFAAMAALGFSLNMLTLFGLVLAIGIVVDDAIVVVEAVGHHIEHGMAPREATIKAMQEVSGPVVAVGLVLSAVFLPCAFITGIIGQFFRQFALTIAVSTLISAFNSLTLSPALCAILLKPHSAHKGYEVLPIHGIAAACGGLFAWLLPDLVLPWLGPTWAQLAGAAGEEAALWVLRLAVLFPVGYIVGLVVSKPLNLVLGVSFKLFNMAFNAATTGYTWVVAGMLRVSILVLVVYGGLLALTWLGFEHTPTGFIPAQDRGYLLVNVQLPDGASVGRTHNVMQRIEAIARKTDGVKHTVAVAGQSILLNANSSNFGSMYVMLDDFHERLDPDLSADAIARTLEENLEAALSEENDNPVVTIFGAPPVEGLGTAGGFKIVIEDHGNNGPEIIQEVADHVVEEGNRPDSDLQGLFTGYRAKTPWLFLDIDRTEAQTLGVSQLEVINALQVYLGSYYVNDFNRFGRTWEVNVQGDVGFRMDQQDINWIKIRNAMGKMVPLASVAHMRPVNGPVMVSRYNLYPAALVNGNPRPGVSSGQAIEQMKRLTEEQLPRSMQYEWTELALLQLQTGNTAMYAFVLAVVLVFLVLAAQYESWALPLAVILVVPMCLLFSIAGVLCAEMDINIFTQVGFIVLVGLACKNAILIVEFAKQRHEEGASRWEATLAACRLRLRPILMTSFAFIFGVIPLMVSEGAGAEMRRTLGTAVFAGMLGVTLFGIFLTPVFYFVIQWFSDRRQQRKHGSASPEIEVSQANETRIQVSTPAH